MKLVFISLFIQLSLVVFLSSPSAQNLPSDTSDLQSRKTQKVCDLIREKVEQGKNIKDIVKTSIQMGFRACPVIRCSIEAGGDLEQIVTGTVEAGITPDVVSRCALDSGADANSIAAILTGLAPPAMCYTIPEEQYIFEQPKARAISPSSF